MIPLIKSQCDVNWQIRCGGDILFWDSSNEFYRVRLNRVLHLKFKELRVTQHWAVVPVQSNMAAVMCLATATLRWGRGGAVSHVKIGVTVTAEITVICWYYFCLAGLCFPPRLMAHSFRQELWKHRWQHVLSPLKKCMTVWLCNKAVSY